MVGLIGVVALGASLAAVETTRAVAARGSIRGRVLVEDPVSGMGTWSNVTVEVRSHGSLVSEAHASRNGVFAVRLPPGTYVLSTPSHSFDCWTNAHQRASTVAVRSGERSTVTLSCLLKYPLGSTSGAGARGR